VLDECWEDTISVIQPYTEVLNLITFTRPRKQGLAAAKNFGIQKCSGDWIAYLDADDEWMDCKLEVQRDFMLSNSHVDFCGTQAWDREHDVLYPNCFKTTQYNTHEEIAQALNRENVMCHGSMMIRRIALESLGFYSTSSNVLGREDWDLWARAVNAGFTFAKVPERLYIYSLGTSVPR
jgi:glycosyltransferase involved in cell wall biosynthesis